MNKIEFERFLAFVDLYFEEFEFFTHYCTKKNKLRKKRPEKVYFEPESINFILILFGCTKVKFHYILWRFCSCHRTVVRAANYKKRRGKKKITNLNSNNKNIISLTFPLRCIKFSIFDGFVGLLLLFVVMFSFLFSRCVITHFSVVLSVYAWCLSKYKINHPDVMARNALTLFVVLNMHSSDQITSKIFNKNKKKKKTRKMANWWLYKMYNVHIKYTLRYTKRDAVPHEYITHILQ